MASERDWIDKVTLGLEGFGLAVLVVYTVFSGMMYFVNKNSADAAKSAAETGGWRTLPHHLNQRR